MAKTATTRRTTRHMATLPVRDAAAAIPQLPVIKVAMADRLDVLVDVNDMTIPYTIAFDGSTLIKSLVDRQEAVPATSGSRLLGWSFAHTQKGWKHSVSYQINGGAVKVLESKSEADKDPDHSVGVAVVERT